MTWPLGPGPAPPAHFVAMTALSTSTATFRSSIDLARSSLGFVGAEISRPFVGKANVRACDGQKVA